MHRFYISPTVWNADDLRLDESESHHALNVLRLKAGDKVVAFNGRGVEATAEISPESAKGAVRLKIRQTARTPSLPCRITLAQAIPKGKNMDFIVQKAVELGAGEIAPLLSERVVSRLDDADDAAAKREKWQTVAIEAAKQCGQNWLPEIGLPQSPKTFFGTRGASSFDLMLIASLQSDARHLREYLADFSAAHPPRARPASALVLVGPEGDFTPAELALARSAGCRPITLGPIVLRVETAALYCLSVLSYELLSAPV